MGFIKKDVKQADKVHQRIGRARERYPSVQQYYTIDVAVDEKTKAVTEISWKKDETGNCSLLSCNLG